MGEMRRRRSRRLRSCGRWVGLRRLRGRRWVLRRWMSLSRDVGTAHKPLSTFSVDHFRRYAGLLVFDDGERREPEDWQLALAEDLFAGFQRNLWVIPEGNGKALDVLTPLPVADGGHVLMRDVQVGD